ncbi:uncharacterized protein LOC108745126 [Agrilus planipennis]|uniref:Uncharacterized protein LOC108745126 n=1 Tax=Agrilus planipennis TaxID=224129 RepID=A0A1W4XWA1_AGRPL|nr:uncharacterized protein LOC108745126 [Agrilus planipennis]XP_018336707.1 uncharacterized protein LOC108745126 [Agrilus planipennis]XP_018336708.1 uncharacterized protein LOC108745126 [Agrilus planipennis]XP_018336709.1 uncharacterized protein LOC108745126 [Agrilus planipennis]XP_018336710.1 uncharacterized protein LOC108745126 [Agrilus planipennis]
MPVHSDSYSPVEKRMSSLSIGSRHREPSEYSISRYSQKYDPYQNMHAYEPEHPRVRLSSTGEGSGDSSTTTSGSSYGEREDVEREDGSEGRGSEEADDRDDTVPLEGQVTDDERQKVETFFRGLKTQVYVSGSLANLYTKTPLDPEWALKHTGIPVVLLDVGESRARDKRRIQIVLAERGTGFMLWRDTIDNLTSYKVAGKAFHTMCYSGDHTLQIGFSFDTAQAAHDMWTHIERLVACPENISLSVPGKKKKKKEKKPKPLPLPPKNQISMPCCFLQLTHVDHDDRSRFYSLREFVPVTASTRYKKAPLPTEDI